MSYSEKEEQMKAEFDSRAIEAIGKACSHAVDREMLDYLVPLLIERADKNGATFAIISGKRIDLALFWRREPNLQEYILVSVKEGQIQ